MVGQQVWWGRGLAAVAVLALAGCSVIDEVTSTAETDGKPSVSASASAGTGGGAADSTDRKSVV